MKSFYDLKYDSYLNKELKILNLSDNRVIKSLLFDKKKEILDDR